MSVQRFVRMGLAGLALGTAMQAATAVHLTEAANALRVADAGTAARALAEPATVRADWNVPDKQATALISQRFADIVRPDTTDLARTQLTATRALGAGPVDPRKDTAARTDSDVAHLVDHEIYALIAAGLLAVLSLSRRRNL